MSLRRSRIVLALTLLALSILFLFWFKDDRQRVVAWALFAGPPALLLVGVLRDRGRAALWSGVFGLFWFSHGVMLAWSRPSDRAYALIEIALALIIVFAASAPGLSAGFAKRRR